MKSIGLMFLFILVAMPGAFSADLPYRRFISAFMFTPATNGFELKTLPENAGYVMQGKFPSTNSLKAAFLTKKLDQPLAPGSYLVFISVQSISKAVSKAFIEAPPPENELLDAVEGKAKADPDVAGVEIRLGDAGQVLRFSRKAGAYSGGVILKLAAPADELKLQVRTIEPEISIGRVYVSAVPSDMVKTEDGGNSINTDGIASELRSNIIPMPPNVIANGSFEVGPGSYDWCTAYQSSAIVSPSNLDSSCAYHGERSLRLPLAPHRYAEAAPPSAQLKHAVIRLKSNSTYFFQGRFRSDANANVSVNVSPVNGKPLGSGAASLGTNWGTLAFSFKTADDTRDCFLDINASSTAPRETWKTNALHVWLDALVLSTKQPDGFVPAASLEAGVIWSAPGKIFYADEKDAFTILAHNYSAGSPAKAMLECRVVDYFGREVLRKPIDLGVPGGTTMSTNLDPRTGRTGAFRLLLSGTADTPQGTASIPLQEYAFCVLPRPPAQMQRTFGAYMNMSSDALRIMSRAGIRRTTTLSCGNECLSVWNVAEPQPGKFRWWDDRVAWAKENDVEIIANLELQSAPDWATKPANPEDTITCSGPRHKIASISKAALSEFVTAMVSHYKKDIHKWLIVDEPYHYFNMDEYFKVVKAASEAAKKADPTCQILLHCAYYAPNLKKLDELGIAPYIDGVSGYSRDPEQGLKLKLFREKHKLPMLLTVEYSWQVSMYQTIEAVNSWIGRSGRNPTTYRENTANLAIMPVAYMARAAADGFNRYDARFPGGDFTQLDNYKCMFEYDGALKPSAVAYAVTAIMLDGFHGVEQLKIRDDVESYLLEDTARFALVFRAPGLHATRLALPAGVEARDIMGNRVRAAPQTILCGDDMLTLIGPRDTLAAAKALVAGLTFSAVVEATPTTRTDAKTGQYGLDLAVKNALADEDIQVSVYSSAPLREFWNNAGTELPSLPPGQSAKVSLGLNAYTFEVLKPEPANFVLLVRAGAASGILNVSVSNAYGVSSLKPGSP